MLTISNIVLGEGLSARVYKGTLGKRVVAVKTFKNSRHLFQQELAILLKISHPSVPRVLGYACGTYRHLVMEFGRGVTLAHGLENHKVSKDSERRIVRALLDVLRYLHSLRIVHRDVKPANIIVSFGSTGVFTVRVIDFGFAVVLPKGQDLFRDGRVVGTRGFVAPEIDKECRYSPASDMYAFGRTLACLHSPRWLSWIKRCTAFKAEDRPSAAECYGFVS